MKERVAFYARVSSDEQADKGTIQTQLEYARGRAKLEGWQLIEFVDDGVSGKKISFAKRPEGARLLDAARRGEFARVVTYRLDRLGRRARFIHEALEDFTAAGAAYASLTEPFDTATPAGKLFLGVLAVMAEFESDSIQQRTAEGKHRVSTLDDRWLAGVVPYGYSLTEDSRLVIDPTEAAIVREAFALTTAGRSSAQVADEFNARGIPACSDRRGKRKTTKSMGWEPGKISRMVRAEIYAGRAAFFRSSRSHEVAYRDVPAIVSPSTFLSARKATAKNKQFGRSHSRFDYQLRGLVRCGKCDYMMIGRPWGKAHGYYCHHCTEGRAFVDEQKLLAILWGDVLGFLEKPDATLRALAHSASESGSAEEQAEQELVALAQQLREADEHEAQLLDLRLAKTISGPVLEKKAKAIAGERERIRLRMEAVREDRAKAARAVEESVSVRQLLGQLHGRASGANEAARAEIIRTVTKGVTFQPATGYLQVRYAFGANWARPVGVVPTPQSQASSP